MTGSRKTRRRQRAERAGRLAEWLAIFVLLLKGYQLAAHRCRTPFGELDLVLRKRGLVVFMEVKHRKAGARTGDVSARQADRLVRAASWYLARRAGEAEETRFDLMLTGGWRWPRHVQNVFMADAGAMRAQL